MEGSKWTCFEFKKRAYFTWTLVLYRAWRWL